MDKRSSTSILGVIEGFYGVFYTFPERLDLIRFIGKQGFNHYLYAPKNDRQHRARWWEAYPEKVMEQFATTVQVAQEAGVTFGYAISPGEICYSSSTDFNKVTGKLKTFYEIGVRSFGLLYDDYAPVFHHAADQEVYTSVAQAQADLANRLLHWLRNLHPDCTLQVCPVDYYGQAPFSRYLSCLGSDLNPDIDLFYTGREICSPTITASDARQFADAAYHKPLLWDNYPVNDLAMQSELHIGPVQGRSADLPKAVKGLLANTMIQAEASKIPLLTLAEYWHNPTDYNAKKAWQKALGTVAGEESALALQLVAENAIHSCLGGPEGETLERLSNAAIRALEKGQSSSALDVLVLENYLAQIDEATYHLKFRMENLALRSNLLPWIEVLEHWIWMTRFALQALRAIEQEKSYLNDLKRVHEYRDLIESHPKVVMAQSLLPFVDYILKRVENDQRRRISLEWAPSIS